MNKALTQVYLNDISDNMVIKIFEEAPYDYVFRHTDCPIVFTTDGYFLYAEDMDFLNVDPFYDYNFNKLLDYYNNPQEFIDTFKHIEEVINREIFLVDWQNNSDASIRTLELELLTKRKNKHN